MEYINIKNEKVSKKFNEWWTASFEGNRIMGNKVPNLINQIGSRTTEFTLAEKPTMDDRGISS